MLTEGHTDIKVLATTNSDGSESQTAEGIYHIHSITHTCERTSVLAGTDVVVEVADGVVQKSCIGEHASLTSIVGKQRAIAVWVLERYGLEFRYACIRNEDCVNVRIWRRLGKLPVAGL